VAPVVMAAAEAVVSAVAVTVPAAVVVAVRVGLRGAQALILWTSFPSLSWLRFVQSLSAGLIRNLSKPKSQACTALHTWPSGWACAMSFNLSDWFCTPCTIAVRVLRGSLKMRPVCVQLRMLHVHAPERLCLLRRFRLWGISYGALPAPV
jgi:hypothetical protein